MGGRALLALKLALTLGVVLLIWWSLSRPDQGILREITAAGPLGAALVVAAFLALVALYCRDLQRCLSAIAPAHLAAAPKSVWLMFLVPYNFVEDFFIVHNLARSIRAEAAADPALAVIAGRFGLVSGLGWCALQILSLVPLPLGSLAGALALPLWIWHWLYIRRITRHLTHALPVAA